LGCASSLQKTRQIASGRCYFFFEAVFPPVDDPFDVLDAFSGADFFALDVRAVLA